MRSSVQDQNHCGLFQLILWQIKVKFFRDEFVKENAEESLKTQKNIQQINLNSEYRLKICTLPTISCQISQISLLILRTGNVFIFYYISIIYFYAKITKRLRFAKKTRRNLKKMREKILKLLNTEIEFRYQKYQKAIKLNKIFIRRRFGEDSRDVCEFSGFGGLF